MMVTDPKYMSAMHVLPSCPSSTSSYVDSGIHMSCSTGYWHSSQRIEKWIAEVQEAVSLPSLIGTQFPRCRGKQPEQRNSFFKISAPIPRDTFTSIRRQLLETISTRDPITLLEQLPHRRNRPLVSSMITLASYLCSRY